MDPEMQNQASAPQAKKRILLVEDDQEIQNFYKEYLSKYFNVDTAGDGLQGLNMLAAGNYDLVVLDIMTPKYDGITFLQMKSRDQKIKDVPVVVLTNLANDDIIKQAFTFGAKSYIFKAETTPDKIVPTLMDAMKPSGKPEGQP